MLGLSVANSNVTTPRRWRGVVLAASIVGLWMVSQLPGGWAWLLIGLVPFFYFIAHTPLRSVAIAGRAWALGTVYFGGVFGWHFSALPLDLL